MINFYFCNKFSNKIDKDKNKIYIIKRIEELKNRNTLDSIGNIQTFGGGLYVLKISTPKIRIIIEENNNIFDRKVFFIRDIILSKDFDRIYRKIYSIFYNVEWLKNNPLSKEDIDNAKEEYKKSQNKIFIKQKYPPRNLTNWLNGFKLELNNEIFETEQWVRYALDNSQKTGMIDKYVNTFRLVLEDIRDNNLENDIIRNIDDIKIYKYIKYNIGILYSKINIDNKNIIILYNGSHIQKQEEYWEKSIKELEKSELKISKDIEDVSRNSYRSYPKWTVSDDDLWFAIQKSKEMSNLSLTNEQSQFFINFKFPYYINGQAGSGKSTMLYYLFSNVYYYKTQGEIDGEIVFLTENEKLLNDTKKYVYELLTNNPEFNGLSREDINSSKKYFHSFKNFLLNLLSNRDRDNFIDDKYLNFSIFKELYENSNLETHIINKYSAEESWFTIITYIYGYSLSKKIKSENYTNEIPYSSQVISMDKFIGIEKNVLPFYEKLLDDGYWDKLKIIRYIHDNINMDIKGKYSVIVCDEAQDFCKVELQFILRMSEYLKYDLSKIEQVPIIFAGDPNQTVNPTGFREDEMTSLLYKELKEIAGFNYNNNENIYNPSLNYRSSHSVVALANFIQYYRVKNLGIKQAQPQEAKRPISNIDREFNLFLNYGDIHNDGKLKNDLVEKLKYKIFIVPIDSQEKYKYVKKSNLLSSINKIEVKTSIEAKGAEYKQVVLYGFGEYFLDKFESLKENNSDELFKIGYFFNKLYVGITRAQSELIIIDSKESKKKFWEKLVDNAEINDKWKILDNLKNNTIEYNGYSINHILISNKNDALENAKKDKKQGEYHNNSARLRVASNQFFKLGYEKEANECLALAEEIKNNYKSAGEYYLKSQNIEKASISYFKGRYFDDLEKIGNNLKSAEQDIRMIIARIMNREILVEKEINFLVDNLSPLYSLTKDLDWRDELIDELLIFEKKITRIEFKREFVKVLKYISKSTDTALQKEIANIYYQLEEYKQAINIWEEIDFYEEPYDKAKFIVAQKIVREYKKDNNIEDDEEALSIYLSYIDVENIDEIIAIGIIIEYRFEDNLIELMEFYQDIIQNLTLKQIKYLYLLKRWAKTIWKINKDSASKKWLEELNNQYKKFNIDLPYKEFSLNELQHISKNPKDESQENIKHFSKITINNFRQFESISLDDIGMFNLVVGDNNVGKTSLLEALLFIDDNEIYFNELAFAYMARNSSRDLSSISFIKDFIKKDNEKQEFEFILEKDRSYSKYKVRLPSKDEIKDKFGIQIGIDIDDYICMMKDDSSCDISELPLVIKKIETSEVVKTQFIPFGKGFDRDLVKIYAQNIDRDREKRKEFLNSMRVFIPNIDRITPDTREGQIYIEEKAHQGDSPLSHYGEGAKKLFRILVQITLQKDKKLLIDEIDAGIHYSHFLEFWKVILKVAKANNVQIFATTHNIECIEYFKEVLEEEDMKSYQNLSKTITLRKLPNNSIKAFTREFKEFQYEIDNELEIRGGKL